MLCCVVRVVQFFIIIARDEMHSRAVHQCAVFYVV